MSYVAFADEKLTNIGPPMRWLWAALSRRTRQVVAYVIGDRSRPDRVKRLSEDWYEKFLLSIYDANLTATYGSLTRYFAAREIMSK
jgi:IS1 family transposase